MKREHRYTIFKVKDIKNYLPEYMQERLDSICDIINRCRASDNKPLLECVCVESDWPEYETVWGLIEARVDGKPNELDQLRAENEKLKTTLCKYQHIASPEDRKVTKLLTEIERLKAELAESKNDAERFRWLARNGAFGLSGAPGWSGVIRFQLVEQDSRNMSEAIDAAMKGK